MLAPDYPSRRHRHGFVGECDQLIQIALRNRHRDHARARIAKNFEIQTQSVSVKMESQHLRVGKRDYLLRLRFGNELEAPTGIEPAPRCLQDSRSAFELRSPEVGGVVGMSVVIGASGSVTHLRVVGDWDRSRSRRQSLSRHRSSVNVHCTPVEFVIDTTPPPPVR